MGGEALLLGKAAHLPAVPLQGLPGVVAELGLFDEVIHRQGAVKPGGAHGGQGVVGPGKVVPHGLRVVAAQEDGAGVFDHPQVVEGVIHRQLQVLRGDAVGHRSRLGEGPGHDNLSVGLDGRPGDFLPLQGLELAQAVSRESR